MFAKKNKTYEANTIQFQLHNTVYCIRLWMFVFLHPKPQTAWPRTSSPGRTWWCCWFQVHKRLQTPVKMAYSQYDYKQVYRYKVRKQSTSKRRWSASSKGFPSSLLSTWATPVTESIHTIKPLILTTIFNLNQPILNQHSPSSLYCNYERYAEWVFLLENTFNNSYIWHD